MNFLLGIPVYNEEPYLSDFFENLILHLPKSISKIVAVNDGSTDASKEILEKIQSKNKNLEVIHRYPNQGYGASMIFLLEYAKKNQFDFLVTMDCDKQHKVEDLYKFLELDFSVDVVSGSRYMPDSPFYGIEPPRERILINQKITKKINQKYHFNLSDAFCGFKRYKLNRIENIFTEKGYGFPLEFWTYCYYFKMSIQEVSVTKVYITDDRSFGENLNKHRVRYKYYLRVWKEAERKFSNLYGRNISF
ncbi:MAG: glycosyltransferase family 2 protein [Leptonema sp. (in: bacteria)]